MKSMHQDYRNEYPGKISAGIKSGNQQAAEKITFAYECIFQNMPACPIHT
jgi:hypothetical protein